MMDLTCESMTAGFLSNDYDQYVEIESITLPHEYMHAYDRNDALKEDCSNNKKTSHFQLNKYCIKWNKYSILMDFVVNSKIQ